MKRKAGQPHKGWKAAARKKHARSVASAVDSKVHKERVQCIADMRSVAMNAQSLGLLLAAHLLHQAIQACDWVGAPSE